MAPIRERGFTFSQAPKTIRTSSLYCESGSDCLAGGPFCPQQDSLLLRRQETSRTHRLSTLDFKPFMASNRQRSQLMKHFIGSLLLFAFTPVAPAQIPAGAEISPAKTVDRTQYTLFNPTPPALMRDFAPDRPNVTDAPYTVDPGHFLLELGIFEYTRDHNKQFQLDGFAFGDTNVRLGVTSYAEIDLLFTAYAYLQTRDTVTGENLKQSGFSDLTLRSKINFFGNDGGPFAIGLIPFVTFPTGANGIGNRGFAGGIGVPVQFALPAGFQLGIESTVQTVHDPGGGSHFEYPNSISIGHQITKKLSTYLEFATDVGAAEGWIGTVDTALVYQPVNNWQLDAGVNIGVTRAANGLFTFVGAAWRY
jgi:hypothetical protein